MAYKPTGKPPGRPRLDGEAPKPKTPSQAKLVREGIGEVIPGQDRPFTDAPICPVCWPDGWPKGWTGTACPHGVWARSAGGLGAGQHAVGPVSTAHVTPEPEDDKAEPKPESGTD